MSYSHACIRVSFRNLCLFKWECFTSVWKGGSNTITIICNARIISTYDEVYTLYVDIASCTTVPKSQEKFGFSIFSLALETYPIGTTLKPHVDSLPGKVDYAFEVRRF